MPESTFASIGLSADIVRELAAQGIESPFQIQTRVIPAALAGQDVLAKAPTGSGKTLAFAIPIVERLVRGDGRPSALMLVPTRELAVQVTEVLAGFAGPRPRGRIRLRRRADSGAGREGEEGPCARRHAGPPAGPDGSSPRLTRRRLGARARRSRQDARHGIQAAGRQDLARVSDDRQTMFFSATLDGAVGELARAYTNQPWDRGRIAERAQAR